MISARPVKTTGRDGVAQKEVLRGVMVGGWKRQRGIFLEGKRWRRNKEVRAGKGSELGVVMMTGAHWRRASKASLDKIGWRGLKKGKK